MRLQAGLVVDSYDYDSYGNIEASFEGIANPFTYTGRELDAESGLYYYRARYYDSETGRFLSEDQLNFAARVVPQGDNHVEFLWARGW